MNSDESEISNLLKKHRSDLTYAIPASLKEKLTESVSSRSPSKANVFSWFSLSTGVMVACVSLIVAFELGQSTAHPPSEQFLVEDVVSSHVRSLMVSHLSDVVSTDKHTVKPWFEGKLDFSPDVRDFKDNGFPLIGGRLDYIGSRAAAALVFKFQLHVVNVLEYPVQGAEHTTPHFNTVRGYQLFSWTKNGMMYWVVSDLNASDLERFVNLWRD
jgi:anti-sigma factor RsiW